MGSVYVRRACMKLSMGSIQSGGFWVLFKVSFDRESGLFSNPTVVRPDESPRLESNKTIAKNKEDRGSVRGFEMKIMWQTQYFVVLIVCS
jgi:hypothetical protein